KDLTLLDGLQICNDGTHILSIKCEFRHIRVTGHDALSQCLLQGFDRITLTEAPERGGRFVRTLANSADGMARCAVLSQQLFAASRILRNGLLCSHKRDYQDRRNASAAARLLASVTRVVPACNNVSIGRCARARIYKQAAAALRHAISRQKRVPPCTAAIECPPGIRNSIFERHAIHRRQPKRGRMQRQHGMAIVSNRAVPVKGGYTVYWQARR